MNTNQMAFRCPDAQVIDTVRLENYRLVFRSNGGGKGKTVNGTYTVKYYYTGRKCGVHIDGLGWVPESGCTVIG